MDGTWKMEILQQNNIYINNPCLIKVNADADMKKSKLYFITVINPVNEIFFTII